jgi:hypothetical protein
VIAETTHAVCAGVAIDENRHDACAVHWPRRRGQVDDLLLLHVEGRRDRQWPLRQPRAGAQHQPVGVCDLARARDHLDMPAAGMPAVDRRVEAQLGPQLGCTPQRGGEGPVCGHYARIRLVKRLGLVGRIECREARPHLRGGQSLPAAALRVEGRLDT